jgi:Na+/H+ antiporter NhaB
MTAFKQVSQAFGSKKLANLFLTASAVMYPAGLAIHSTPEQFKTTNRFVGRLNGETFGKAATTALTFTAAHVVTASKFAVILVQITPAGVISTKVPASTQAYNSAALALAALPAPDAGNVAMGYIAIAAKAATWTANTDDLTNGSDLTTAAFTSYPALTFGS